MKTQSLPVLGIDIGRVIIGAADPSGRADTSFISGTESKALRTPATEGAIEAITRLTRAFEGRVWLVSKCGPRIQQLTRRWLEARSFFAHTGIAPENLRFCLKRPEKRDHCAAIGATHFIDDRLDVLEHLTGLVPHLYWFGHQQQPMSAPVWAEQVLDWSAAEARVLSRLATR